MLLRNSARIFYIGEKQVDGQYEILTFVFQRFEILFQRAWIRGSYLCKRNCTFFTCRDVTKRNRFYNTFSWKSNLSIQWIINYWNGNVILIFVKLSKICPLLAVQDTSLFNYRLLGQSIQRNVWKHSINKKWKRCHQLRRVLRVLGKEFSQRNPVIIKNAYREILPFNNAKKKMQTAVRSW